MRTGDKVRTCKAALGLDFYLCISVWQHVKFLIMCNCLAKLPFCLLFVIHLSLLCTELGVLVTPLQQ